MSTERPKHPSGRPLSRQKFGATSIFRIPDRGPVTPRLRDPEPRDAIGFRYVEVAREGDDDE